MYALLGTLQFNLITYFNGVEETQKATYAEHQVIGAKSKQQFTGDELDTMVIRLNFHSSFCSPETELKKLKTMAKTHEEQAFILGNGKYIGRYVIEEITSNTIQTDKSGNMFAVEAEVRLKEYYSKQAQVKKKQQKQGLKKR
jgi:phage protein U